jgi:serine/threonine protein kinase
MITDFGMSFFAATPQPEFGKLGAIRWRAPEFIATKKASFAADVYSLGMCIVEAVTGRVPWGIVPDSAVKLHLKRKTFLTQPESMSDDEWALVCAMCNFDPSKRMALEQVEKRIREFADREEEKEAERLEMLEQPAEGSLGYFNSDSPSNVQPMMVPRR